MSMKPMEKPLLLTIVALVRALFAIYRPATTAALLLLLIIVATPDEPGWLAACLASAVLLIFVVIPVALSLFGSFKANPNPMRGYFGTDAEANRKIDRFIRALGKIKIYPPFIFIEEPQGYKISGRDMRELMETLQPGDILLRGYDGYLDGELIRMSGAGAEGVSSYMSHAAFYLGELGEAQKSIAARRLRQITPEGKWIPASQESIEDVRNDPEYVQLGRQMVIHSMAKGVFTEDLLTFLRCDYLIVLRLPELIKLTAEQQAKVLSDPDFKAYRELLKQRELLSEDGTGADATRILKDLEELGEVQRDTVIAAARESALGKIGSCYDFQFSELESGNMFSCSEFVYYCYKSIHEALGIHPKEHAFMGKLFPRVTLTPADLYDIAKLNGGLEVAYLSPSLGKLEGEAAREYARWRRSHGE